MDLVSTVSQPQEVIYPLHLDLIHHFLRPECLHLTVLHFLQNSSLDTLPILLVKFVVFEVAVLPLAVEVSDQLSERALRFLTCIIVIQFELKGVVLGIILCL